MYVCVCLLAVQANVHVDGINKNKEQASSIFFLV